MTETTSDNEIERESIKVELSEKYVPLLHSLKDIWDCKDLNEVLKKSVLLMVYLTSHRENGATFYIQDKDGKSIEMPLLSKDDISKDSYEVELSALNELKKLI